MTRRCLDVIAAAGCFTLLCGLSPAMAATAPNLGTAAPYAIVSSTFTNSNTSPQTTIVGNVCYTTGPAAPPLSTSGATVVPCPPQVGLDQNSALANLNSQSCLSLGAAVALNGITVVGNPPGTFPPGCYSSTGAMNITAGTTVTLSGSGVYIFRPAGALTTGANSHVVLAGGSCANDVFWTPIATTLGATSDFTGTIIDNAGITIGHFATLAGRALSFGGTVTTDADTIGVSSACSSPVPPVPPVPVPTLPLWAMIALAGLLALGGLASVRRRAV